jgi:hypothetical protein
MHHHPHSSHQSERQAEFGDSPRSGSINRAAGRRGCLRKPRVRYAIHPAGRTLHPARATATATPVSRANDRSSRPVPSSNRSFPSRLWTRPASTPSCPEPRRIGAARAGGGLVLSCDGTLATLGLSWPPVPRCVRQACPESRRIRHFSPGVGLGRRRSVQSGASLSGAEVGRDAGIPFRCTDCERGHD